MSLRRPIGLFTLVDTSVSPLTVTTAIAPVPVESTEMLIDLLLVLISNLLPEREIPTAEVSDRPANGVMAMSAAITAKNECFISV